MQYLFEQIALLGDVWVLWILVGMSVLGGAVFFDRRRMLQSARGFGESPGVAARVAGDLESRAPNHDPIVLEQTLQALLLRARGELEQRLVVLGTIGSNAPFVGLLGTVLGIIQAFHDLAVAGEGGTEVVMAGIASALVITAVGLFVAIPAVVANNYLRTIIDDELAKAEAEGRLRLADLLAKPTAPKTARKGGASESTSRGARR